MSSKYRMIWRLMEGQRLRYGAAIGAMAVASCFMYLVPLVPQVVIDGVLSEDPAKVIGRHADRAAPGWRAGVPARASLDRRALRPLPDGRRRPVHLPARPVVGHGQRGDRAKRA